MTRSTMNSQAYAARVDELADAGIATRPLARRVYRMYRTGASFAAIARYLNEGREPPQQYLTAYDVRALAAVAVPR